MSAVLLVTLAAGALTFLAGCGGDGNASEEPASVNLRLIAIDPATVTVPAGSTVTWAQHDPGAHTVTSGTVEQGAAGVTTVPDGRFNSGEIATGGTFRFTFDEPGTYPYFCSIHPATMRGEVRVT